MSIVMSADDSKMRILLSNGYFLFILLILESLCSTSSLKKNNICLKLKGNSEICQELGSDLVLRFLEEGFTTVLLRSILSNKVHFKNHSKNRPKRLPTKLVAVIGKN